MALRRTKTAVQELEDSTPDLEELEETDTGAGDELDIEANDEEEIEPEVATATPTDPVARWETPTGTPVQVIHQCNHALTQMLEELLLETAKCKRLVAIINGSTPADANGKRPGDHWLEEVLHYQGIKRQATNELVAQAMRQ